MRVLITGGAGFIGSQLGQHFDRRGDEVLLLDNMSFGHLDNLLHDGRPFGRFICADVRDAIQPYFEGVDTVFHLAGIAALPVCQQDPGAAYAVNTAAVGNILEAARRANVRRVIFSSTSAVYENSSVGPFAEDAGIAPDLIYACTKEAAEQVCDSYAVNYGMDIIVCRFFNVYGPHQDVMRTSPPFTSYLSREFVLGRSPRVFNWTDARRDYVYVDDVVDLLTRMRDSHGSFRADRFNVCSGQGFTVPEIYEHFETVSQSRIEPIREDPERYWDAYPSLFDSDRPMSRERITKEVFKNAIGDPAKAEAAFGWKAATPMRDGIAAVYVDAKRRLTP